MEVCPAGHCLRAIAAIPTRIPCPRVATPRSVDAAPMSARAITALGSRVVRSSRGMSPGPGGRHRASAPIYSSGPGPANRRRASTRLAGSRTYGPQKLETHRLAPARRAEKTPSRAVRRWSVQPSRQMPGSQTVFGRLGQPRGRARVFARARLEPAFGRGRPSVMGRFGRAFAGPRTKYGRRFVFSSSLRFLSANHLSAWGNAP